VSLIKTITSAFGKMAIVAALLGAFLVGLVSVVWLSLRGEEVKVPEVVGKDVLESEKELAALGLKLKRRANRFSEEKPNTILEQLPKSGDSVKTGQTISVVVSRINPEGSEEPAVIEKNDEANSAGNSTENPSAAANKKKEVKKPVSTTRDVESSKANKNSNITNKNGSTSNKNGSNSNKSETNKDSNSSNKSGSATNTVTKANTTVANKPVVKPVANTGGDIRPRKVPQ
jgi:PASTA domain